MTIIHTGRPTYDKIFQFGCIDLVNANATSYLFPGAADGYSEEATIRAPHSGTLRNLYIQQRVASGASGRTDIYTVRVNATNTSITCTLDNATQGSDTTHNASISAGDRISIKIVSNNASDTSADIIATLELTQ